eukprot:78293-Hanusia_phi.AAC.1
MAHCAAQPLGFSPPRRANFSSAPGRRASLTGCPAGLVRVRYWGPPYPVASVIPAAAARRPGLEPF